MSEVPANGLYFNVPNNEYQAWDCLSNSRLGPMARSPAHFRYALDHPTVPELGDALNFGSAFHTLILQPYKWDEEVAVLPDAVDADIKGRKTFWQTNDGKAYKAEWLKTQEDMTQIKSDQVAQLDAMAAAVDDDPVAGPLMKAEGYPEVSVVFNYHEVKFRSRLDKILRQYNGRDVVVDLKTCASGDMDHMRKAIYDYGYYTAAAAYFEASKTVYNFNPTAFIFVCVEKEPPYVVSTYELGPITLNAGKKMNQLHLEQYRHCAEHDWWPGYTPEIAGLDFAEWQLNKIDLKCEGL